MLSYEYVKNHIEGQGYVLLSDNYVRCKDKLQIQCSSKHIFLMSFDSFHNGCRCPVCAGKKKYTYDYVKDYIESKEHILLSNIYNNSHCKLFIQCPQDHIFEMSFYNFKKGNGCPVCAGNIKHSIDYVKNFIEEQNYSLVSTEYLGAHEKIVLKCPDNHIFSMKYNSFQQGQRCPECYKEQHRSIVKHSKYELYRLTVNKLSNTNYKKFKHLINPSNLPRGRNKYHLDHKFSVYDGFNHNIPPEIIASVFNLQMLPECDNISKHKKSSISIKMLKESVNNEVYSNK